LAILLNSQQNLILRISTFPAGPLRIEISWAAGIDILRTVEKIPAGCLTVPEARHLIPPYCSVPLYVNPQKKAIKSLAVSVHPGVVEEGKNQGKFVRNKER